MIKARSVILSVRTVLLVNPPIFTLPLVYTVLNIALQVPGGAGHWEVVRGEDSTFRVQRLNFLYSSRSAYQSLHSRSDVEGRLRTSSVSTIREVHPE